MIKVAGEAQPTSPIRSPIRYISTPMSFLDRWEKDKTVDVGITTALINREIIIAATPGEPMHKLQATWKQEAGVAYPLFYSYTYSEAACGRATSRIYGRPLMAATPRT